MIKYLYDEIAKRWLRGGTVWVYSDPHFNDPEMVHLRKNYIGDEEQVKRINSKVGKNDTIIFLGDIGDVSFIKRIRGYKVLIMGNHDEGSASRYLKEKYSDAKTLGEFPEGTSEEDIYRKGYKLVDPTPFGNIYGRVWDNKLFDEVYEGPLMINNRLIVSHEPIETLPKYMYNIHGHDHSGWFKSDHHMNMCAEHINYTPVNLIDLIKHGLLKNVESIHRITIDTATEKKAKRLKKAEEKTNEVRDDTY